MSISSNDLASSIPDFFAGRSIFITGGTGFMGKVLMEKLLRTCSQVQEIFLLIRPKRGLSTEDRLRKILELPLFDKLRKEQPNFADKLIPVSGDVAAENLGLSNSERKVLIERVSIVFHVAANVRFDDKLKNAIFVNTRSTREICILASEMKNLAALMHVSTTYSQADKPEVEEKFYDFDVDWKKTIQIAENLDDYTLRILTPKYLGTFPNTYTFTKRLAEQVVHNFSKNLPVIIFRPSIVIATVEDPIPGWMDNFNGPVGLLVGGGSGILRIVYLNPSTMADFIPVDVAIKCMIVAVWQRGRKTIKEDPSIHVYNCCSSHFKTFSLRNLMSMGFEIIEKIPLRVLWFPNTDITMNKTVFYILVLIYHLIPAFFFDQLLKLAGKQPMLGKLQRKVYIANISLEHFIVNVWKFHNDKFQNLLKDIPAADKDSFHYTYFDLDIRKYFSECIIGAKKYLLNESMDKLHESKVQYERMRWVDRIFKVCLWILFSWFLVKTGIFTHIWERSQG